MLCGLRFGLLLASILPTVQSAATEADRGGCARPEVHVASKVHILFIGNSYTYFNNLPTLFEAITEGCQPGTDVEADMVVRGSATLRDLWADGKAAGRIVTSKWDYVVLQEQSTLGPSKDPAQAPGASISDPGEFHAYARQFDDLIRQSGARTVLMMTWPRKNHPELQAALARAYEAIAAERQAILVPAGLAWHDATSQSAESDLYQADLSHPSPTGSYLTAATLYAAIFCVSPLGAPSHIEGRPVDSEGEPLNVSSASGGSQSIQSSSDQAVLVDIRPEEALRLQSIAGEAAQGRCLAVSAPSSGQPTSTRPRPSSH